MAESARHNLSAVAETTYGITPTSPAFFDVRHTSATLNVTKNTTQSEELHEDRQIRDFRHGTRQVGGDFGIELSYGTFDAFLEAVLGGTWTNDFLKAGSTRRSFSFLRHFSDLVTADEPYHLFNGVEMNSLSMTVPADGIVTGSFGVIGRDLVISGSAPASASFGDPTTTRPFDSFTGAIQEGGSVTSIVTELQFTVGNDIQPRFVIGSDKTILPSISKLNVNGSVNAFFEDSTLLKKFLNETHSSLRVTLEDNARNRYEFFFPKVVLNGGQPDTSSGPITLNIPFQAIYDTAAGTTLQVTRDSSQA